jgi:membrane peptidoglycan carboxypeptidase
VRRARRVRLARHPIARPQHSSRLPAIVAAVGVALLLVVGTGTGLAGLTAATAVQYLSTDLPDPAGLAELEFAQPTIVYDRTGTVELGRFEREQRRVVDYAEIPPVVLDATTTAEDRSFWDNDGFDLAAIVAAAADNATGEDDRGASTITQQLVRARLLPDDVVAPGSDRYVRKAKELIQAARLTEVFPGEEGKRQIITAYLNQIFYGHNAYGVAAAAQIYFGVQDLGSLTPAQAALLAALPKSPTTLDPYRFAVPDAEGRLVVPPDAPPVVRRDWILRNLSSSRWTTLTGAALRAALDEPVVLAGDRPRRFGAPHFTWQVRRQLEQILGSAEAVETGGYRVVTTLDWTGQQLAERWLAAAAISPNLPADASERLLASLQIPATDLGWIRALRGRDLHNGSLVALDYRTGDVLAYVGSAGYERNDLASPAFEPKYDAAGDGARQPGSAFKPIVYATAFERGVLTPGSLLLDVTTEFDAAAKWAPRDADQLERGPVLVRRALQYSLNIPAIRALHRVGNEAVADVAARLGVRFAGGRDAFLQSGLAGAIGTVEVRPIDLTAAFGALANGGLRLPTRMVLEIRDPDGDVVWSAGAPVPEPAVSPATAFLVTDILAGNSDPAQNPIWAERLELRNGPDGASRPAAVKTGTANDARDLATYGYLAPPADPAAPAIAVGIWMGNSDHSNPKSKQPATSLTAAAPLWRAFVRDYTAGQPVAAFAPPTGLVLATIDAWTGGRPGGWTRATVDEWFVAGTEPGAAGAVDPDGQLYTRMCGGWRVHPVKAEPGPDAWRADVADWLARARRGTGVAGQYDSRTAFFWGQRSWGGPLAGPCPPPPPPSAPPVDGGQPPGQGGENPGGGPGDGGGGPGDGGGQPPVEP